MTDVKRVDTIVYVMMENRSFDHMLGHLSYGDHDKGLGVEGLREPLDQYRNEHDGEAFHPFEMNDKWLPGDLPHHRHEIARQLAYSDGAFRMDGFAAAYFEYAAEKGFEILDPARPETMGFLPPGDVPVTAFLAENFAVCDHWFSPLPTSTQPNKMMSLAGRTRTDETKDLFPPGSGEPLLIDWLRERNIRWRVYHDGISFFTVFGRFDVMFDDRFFRPLGKLEDDFKREPDGVFPQVILVEPDYDSSPQLGSKKANDNHAPLPVAQGEEFLRSVYQAVIANKKRWKKTVLIVTYDEHGGFYDHVPPEQIPYEPPEGEFERFESTGPRVPALVISPLVSEGMVYSELLDHTSVLQFIAEKFDPDGNGYSPEVNARRDDGIRSVSNVLDLDEPRDEDAPPPPHAPQAPGDDERLHGGQEKEPLQVAFHEAVNKMLDEYLDKAETKHPDLDTGRVLARRETSPGIEASGLRELFGDNAGDRLEALPKNLGRVEVKRPYSFTRGKDPEVTFFIRAHAAGSITAFNSVDDADPDGILATKRDNGEDGGIVDFQPQVELDPVHAWMKYAFDADLTGGAKGSLSNLGFQLDAEEKLRVADYRRHPRKNIALPTVLSDLRHARIAFRLEDVLGLKLHESVFLQFIGTIGTKVELSWADIFTSQFGNLGTLLNTEDVIPLKFSAGATVSASVRFMDDLIVAFSRPEKGKIRVAVRKAKQRKSDYSFEASVKVEFANQKQVDDALASVLEGVIGARLKKARKLLEKEALDKLTSTEAGLLLRVASALGMPHPAPEILGDAKEFRDVVKEAREKLQQLEKDLADAVKNIAAQKVSAGFKYEYSRIPSRSSLLEATLSDDELDTYHGDLIRGDIDRLLKDIQDPEGGPALESYLNRKTVTTEKSWGFTLGIGRWSVFGKDKDKITKTVDENILGQRKFSYRGLRGYDLKWIGEDVKWTMDFRADMERFSLRRRPDPPTMSEYRLGLTLIWERTADLSEEELGNLLDFAHLWRVCSPAGFDTIKDALRPATKEEKECEAVLHLRIDDGLFQRILPGLATAKQSDFAEALGAAMPWMDREGRRSVETRHRLYAPLWLKYFENLEARPANLAALAEKHVKAAGYGDLRALEGLQYVAREPWTFAGLARLNGNTPIDIEDFNEGMRLLRVGVANDQPDNGLVDRVFERIRNFMRQAHHGRALGYYLNQHIERQEGLAGVERTLTVNLGKETFVFGK